MNCIHMKGKTRIPKFEFRMSRNIEFNTMGKSTQTEVRFYWFSDEACQEND